MATLETKRASLLKSPLIDSCLICRSWLWSPDHFCSRCINLLKSRPLEHRHDRGLDIFSLAHYVSPIDQFIRMGKQAACPALTTQLTRIAAQKLALECLTRVEIVVPMPPKNSKNLRDHAYVIGETAAEVLRATLCPEFLNRDGMVAQKEKSQTERRKIKLKAGAGRFGEMGVNGLVLLVDDVVTSGATLFQAWNILGRPEAVALTLASTPLWSRH